MSGVSLKHTLKTNVWALMAKHYGGENITRLARECGLGPATVQRIKDAETSVGLDIIEAIARKFGVQPWQLLTPGMEEDRFLAVVTLWNNADSRGRRMILGAARGALQDESAVETERGSVPGKGQR